MSLNVHVIYREQHNLVAARSTREVVALTLRPFFHELHLAPDTQLAGASADCMDVIGASAALWVVSGDEWTSNDDACLRALAIAAERASAMLLVLGSDVLDPPMGPHIFSLHRSGAGRWTVREGGRLSSVKTLDSSRLAWAGGPPQQLTSLALHPLSLLTSKLGGCTDT